MAVRNMAVAFAAATLATGIVTLPSLDALDGFSIDSLFWLRHKVFGALHDPSASPTAVIAIDEESYRRQPFERTPKALWTPQLAQVLEATLDANAVVIGQDVIFPTTVEVSLPGFDRDYLLFARDAAREGRLVLGKVQHSSKPISPHPGLSFAVGNEKNIRLVNLFRDRDGVIRRLPLTFRTQDPTGNERIEPSMALELAARAVGVAPTIISDGSVRLEGYSIPGSKANSMLINFDTGGRSIPVYSLADLWGCLQAGEKEFFARAFADKVVLVGAVLDVEDRKLTSLRFATGPEGSWFGPRCHHPVMASLYSEALVRDTIPGVFVLAAGVNNLLHQDVLGELSRHAIAALCLLLSLPVALVAFRVPPLLTSIIALTGSVIWTAVSTVSFRQGFALPLVDPILATAITLFIVVGYRFGVSDREKRQVRRAFAYYLPNTVIDRMLETGKTPALGGETRVLTVLFADLEGFTSLSEGLEPKETVALVNQYLTVMTEVIEQHFGFVEKYVGDGVVAVFGAPLPDAEHASHAVEAALAAQNSLSAQKLDIKGLKSRTLRCRIGINSGPMLIGNIGSRRRFNYTVMGDAVNLAARLEQANKAYGTQILVSESTVSECSSRLRFRTIDRVRVRGRQEPLTIHEPIEECMFEDDLVARFECAQKLMQSGEIETARSIFEEISARDPVSAALSSRMKWLADHTREVKWDGVTDLD